MDRDRPLALVLLRTVFRWLDRLAPKLANKWAIRLFLTPVKIPWSKSANAFLEKCDEFEFNALNEKLIGYRLGSGPEVICVHGWSGRAAQFTYIADHVVEAGYTFVAFDAKGHGQNRTSSASIFDFVAALKQVLSTCKEPVAVIGHSLGAATISLAARDGLQIPPFISIGAPVIAEEILDEFKDTINGSERTKQAIRDACMRMYHRSFDEVTMQETVKQLDVPILAIHGDKDNAVGPHQLEVIKKAQPQAETKVFAGEGHRSILKNPEALRLCTAFIQKHR